jgi:hypothetical protein
VSAVDLEVLTVVHHVRVTHGGTGLPYHRIDAKLAEPAWPPWVLRRRGADVALAVSDRFAGDEPAQTTLELAVTDELVLERFQNGGLAQVALHQGGDAEVELVLQPTPVALEATVVDRQNQPRTGRTVQARSNGTVVAMPEVSPGLYRSAATSWDPQLQPFRIFVNSQQRGQAALDYERPITPVRVVDP